MSPNWLERIESSFSLAIPDKSLLNIEHPGFVKNVNNAIKSLGGDEILAQFLKSDAEIRSIGLRLTPQDPFRKPLSSQQKNTSNVLLKITVPKLTGRKRKRGSSDPYSNEDPGNLDQISPNATLRHLLRTGCDRPKSCKIEAVGTVEETHRFRGLPDFQYSLSTSRIAGALKRDIFPFRYEKIQDFTLDTETKGIHDSMDMIPPPIFSQLDIPFPYAYYQNPYVELTVDDKGKQTSVNVTAPRSTKSITAKTDDRELPNGPPPGLQSIETLDARTQKIVWELARIFEQRPIVTRRYITDMLGPDVEVEIRRGLAYHAYLFRSGAWLDCFVKYGLDPRKDPKWRGYQTLMFHFPIRNGSSVWEDGRTRWARSQKHEAEHGQRSYIFDGHTVIPNSKLWQVCDITDPLLRKILDGAPPRASFHAVHDGWYKNGVLAKARVIMRDKIQLLLSGVQPNDSDYEGCLTLPDDITVQSTSNTQGTVAMGKREGALAQEILNIARNSTSKTYEASKKLVLNVDFEEPQEDQSADGANDQTAAQLAGEDEEG